jgi:hypothetical protein
MKLNGTTRTISIILGIVALLGGFIWQASAFTTKVEYKLQEGEERDDAQDSSITKIESNLDYLVRQARLKEIIDSLEKSEVVIQAQKIMENNKKPENDTDTVGNVYSTDDIGND